MDNHINEMNCSRTSEALGPTSEILEIHSTELRRNSLGDSWSTSSDSKPNSYEIKDKLVNGTDKGKCGKSVSFFNQDHIQSILDSDTSLESSSGSVRFMDEPNAKVSTDKLQRNSLRNSFLASTLQNSFSKEKSELENIKEIDEDCYTGPIQGHDEKKDFEYVVEQDASVDENSIPKCIPPWAKTLRTKFGIDSSGSFFEEYKFMKSNEDLRSKIENLMKKHSDLMLVKRVESKKQVILEPSKCHDDMDTIKMRTKNTRYYLAPLGKRTDKELVEDEQISMNETTTNVSLSETDDSERMSIPKKTSRLQAKKEVSKVLKSFHKIPQNKENEKHSIDFQIKRDKVKCPKITLSKVREYVNAQSLGPDERKLHEIIKVEKVPSLLEVKETPGPKYIINVPQSRSTDLPTVNIVKVKEKRKIRVHNVEDVEENIIKLQYKHCGFSQHETKDKSTYQGIDENKVAQSIKKKIKSPTETKTFEVTSKITPLIAPLVCKEKKETDKVLLIQYEKKSKSEKNKPSEKTIKLLGVKKPYVQDSGEMYLYGLESDGTKVDENLAREEDIPLTFKDKVNMIFQELRDMSFKKATLPEITSSEVQVCPTVSVKTTQNLYSTEPVLVQAVPETASVEVQVSQSHLMAEEPFMNVPYPSPASTYSSSAMQIEKENIDETAPEEILKFIDEPEGEPLLYTEDEEAGLKEDSLLIELKDEVSPEKHFAGLIQDSSINVLEVKEIKVPDSEEVEPEETRYASIENDTNSLNGTEIENATIDYELSNEKTPTTDENYEELSETDHVLKTEKLQKGEHEEKMEVLLTVSGVKTELVTETELLEDKVKDSPIPLESIFTNINGHGESFSSTDKKSLHVKREIEEDIRSYDFEPQQKVELKIKSSSKFLHKRGSIRKRMNWKDDTIYLEKNTCPQLIRGLAETAMMEPADPVAYLAHWIYKDYYSKEREEKQDVWAEHLELARVMADFDGRGVQVRKFNIRKYQTENSSKASEGTPQPTNGKLENLTAEITQDA